jgi:Protein of unknown function (DUF1549)/Protein of unknown function (DUF1553)/Bacterial Ig-like domain (group 2)
MSRLCAVAVLAMAICARAADPVRPPIQPAGADLVGVEHRIEAPSFLNDVVPILTRQGCSQGSCHGKGAGQNGFRLSLRGYAPDMDFRWITREFNGRRIETASPEMSLFLRKPIGDAPHEGGKVFDRESREYRVLLNWLKAGAPGPKVDDPKLLRLELSPASKVLKTGDHQQLKAIAAFTDGSRRDVTWLTRFDSNDGGVIAVSPGGLVTARRNGETAIRASFQTGVAVAVITVPFDSPIDSARLSTKNNFIDEHVLAKLAALRIEPSDLCPDEEFIRRAFLDAVGTLPTADEVRAFLSDKSSDKRAKLVDSLLNRPEFVDYWTLILGDLLQNRKERDHDVRGTKGVREMHAWLRKQVAANRPWDQIARDVLTATGSTADAPQIGYFVVTVGEQREPEKSEVVASVAQAFLGTRIGCAQCHNHPLEKYTQDDYYHFAGFFSRVRLERKEPKSGPTVLKVSHPDPNQDKSPIGVRQPRTNEFLKPQPLDRSSVDLRPGDDPREKLVAWMTDPKNEYFAGAMVNRVWRHYLGVGLVEPVDDLRATNPPNNPALWKSLVSEFVDHKYDLKHLMRLILNSRTYQLSSATRPGNETDTRFYSHYFARRLPAEVMLDAISQVTGVADHFPGYPVGLRAIQLPDPGLNSYFLSLFGRSERVTACACERNGDVTMPQLLHLQNGESVVQKIRASDGNLSAWLKAMPDADKLTDEMFLSTFSRPPAANERKAIRALLASGDPKDEIFRDLFWALLNSKNFAFNH